MENELLKEHIILTAKSYLEDAQLHLINGDISQALSTVSKAIRKINDSIEQITDRKIHSIVK